jgi:hypothetical protein
LAIETPLLITTAIHPPDGMPYLNMKAAAPRLAGARYSALYAAVQGVRKIVIADATNCTPLAASDVSLLEEMGCEVEQICYAQEASVAKDKGKGYAEGRLIGFALDESAIIKRTGKFYKLTSKLICRNFDAVDSIVTTNDLRALFWGDVKDGSVHRRRIDARFYLTDPAFAREVLLPAYLTADDRVKAAETAIYESAQQTLASGVAPRPLLTGFSGGTGELYFDESLGFLDRNFPCWLLK